MLTQKAKGVFKPLLFFILALTIFLNAGCEPLRKKFTRKKKAKDLSEEVIPVLQPVDYPKAQGDPQKAYKQHFSLWKVWHKDFLTVLSEGGSQKRKLYIMDQLLAQLEELSLFLDEGKRKELQTLKREVNFLRDEIAGQSFKTSAFSMKKKLMGVDKKIREQFNWEAVQNSIVSAP